MTEKQGPLEQFGTKRSQICLNGMWKCLIIEQNNDDQIVEKCIDVFIPMHRGAKVQKYSSCRFEKSVYIPIEWMNGSILLEQQRGIAKAQVYVNGEYCGTFDHFHDQVEIGKQVKLGGETIICMQVGENEQIQGDLFLQLRPKGAYIQDVFVQTSFRKMELALEIELVKVEWSGTVQLSAEVINSIGEVESCYKTNVIVGNEQAQLIELNWKWDNPTLWDIGQPNMYSLRLSAYGCGIDDEIIQTFGFREFWIEGRKFYLNGTEVRLRPVLCREHGNILVIDRNIDSYIESGFNMMEIWPSKDTNPIWSLLCDRADKKGFAMTMPVACIWDYLETWDDPATREKYKEYVLAEIRRVRNHPSILMWGTNANIFGSGLGMDPRTIGVKKDIWFDKFYWRKRRVPQGEDGIAILKSFDPTRPVFTHHGGGVGDVYTLNFYLNLIPLQEREEWLSHWVKQGEMPFMVVEFGTPLHVSFMRGRTDFGEAILTEPLLSEFSTIYLGKEAYFIETEEYRQKIHEHFIERQDYHHWHMKDYFNFAPAMQKVQALFSHNTWRSWRTMGITGGMIPWNDGHGWGDHKQSFEKVDLGSFEPGTRGWYNSEVTKGEYYGFSREGSKAYPAGKAIMENNGPTLAWIAGSKEAFTAKDHSFFDGSGIEKQVVLINDSRQRQQFNFQLEVFVEGELVTTYSEGGWIETGSTQFYPVKFVAPQVKENKKVIGEIRLQATIGERKHNDTFNFSVFEKIVPSNYIVYLFDPIGMTRKMLEALGFEVKDWLGQTDLDLVVIGRGVLSEGHSLPVNLERFVKTGGKILVFTQDADWLRDNIGFRVAHHISRRVFRISENHQVVKYLNDYDLSDWAGESTLTEAYPQYTPQNTRLSKWWFPYHGYHWGNRGGVSSAALEKPHFSSWRPILECEFDLAYSPLMELDYGKGRVVLCTLDVEDHYELEPAAQMVVGNIIKYADNINVVPKTEDVYLIGDNEDKLRLDFMGMNYQCTRDIKLDAKLLIIGSSINPDINQLIAYINNGGKVFFLPRVSESTPLYTEFYATFNIKLTEETSFHGSLQVPEWEECQGISTSDLRWRTNHTAQILSYVNVDVKSAQIGADGLLARVMLGKGIALFCQINPQDLEADVNTYLRFTRWRQTRTISQLFANMGASFKMDARFFTPACEKVIPLDGEWNSTLNESLKKVKLPLLWEDLDCKWEEIGNDLVFTKIVNIPETWEGKDLLLSLGKIDNTEDTFFNDVCISQLEKKPQEPHNYPRVYVVPGYLVKQGEASIKVCIFNRLSRFDSMGGGGFAGPIDQMFIKLMQGDIGENFYYPDYRWDYVYGDDPYRYFNW